MSDAFQIVCQFLYCLYWESVLNTLSFFDGGDGYTTTVVSGDTVSYILKNQANPGLKILKYDRKTYEVLSGVTFEIFRDGVSLGKFQTEAESENFRRCPQRSRINYQEKISRAAGMQRTGPERPGALCY